MGERLGRYCVLKHLASGGMADVLLARADGIEGFERHVVLKRIKSEHAKDHRFIQMFLDEARVAAGLHHQNIVQVYDIGEESGGYFFAMEYIHGEDLRKLLSAVSKARTHMPLGLVCSIVSAAAAGLHYAHERRDSKKALNIVHRDVSPSNILIGYDGAVKVVDFGIAKAAMRQVETRSGSLKGKVSYMSPEQCKGEDIDRRSDVYALGVLLYELATTTRLFKGDNDYLVMDAIVNGKAPLPRVRRPDLPNELSTIIMRAISVDKNRRYATADELRTALDQFAIKNGLAASTSALAGYMRKMFGGERPEPWLDLAEGGPNIDVDAPTQAAHQSWVEMPHDSSPPGEIEDTQAAPKSDTGGKRPRRTGQSKHVELADTIAPPISTRETRTSMKMGWEVAHNGDERIPFQRRNKLLWLSVPVLAFSAFALWKFGLQNDDTRPVAAHQPAQPAIAAPALAAAPGPQPAPAEAPAPEIPAVRVAGALEPAPRPAAEPAPEPAADSAKKVKKSRADKTEKVTIVAPKPTPAPAPPAKPAVVPAPPAAKPTGAAAPAAPLPAPPPAPPQAPAPAPTPAVAAPPPELVEPPMAMLSNATVTAVASDNSRQLAQCEGGAQLKGDVSVSFQIDGTGKVVKSQLSTSIKNPKVAGCILKAVQSWKFPRPPTGSAKGLYSISYQ
jgi:serine/threonine protein kinase